MSEKTFKLFNKKKKYMIDLFKSNIYFLHCHKYHFLSSCQFCYPSLFPYDSFFRVQRHLSLMQRVISCFCQDHRVTILVHKALIHVKCHHNFIRQLNSVKILSEGFFINLWWSLDLDWVFELNHRLKLNRRSVELVSKNQLTSGFMQVRLL